MDEGNEQAYQAGGSHMKETKTPIPWQVAKNKIEEYTISKWNTNGYQLPSISTQSSFMTHQIKKNPNTF